MTKLMLKRLSQLRRGDVVVAVDGKKRPKPITVERALGPIEPGSPVEGVRFENPHDFEFDFVFYPSQMDGHAMEVERP